MEKMSKEELLKMLNHALELEHAAYIQYLSHAELIEGENAEPIIERLKEIANDEKNHQDKFRSLIGMLGGIPSMSIAETHPARTIREILEQNLKDEKEAVDTYRKIYEMIVKERGKGYYDMILEHEVRHIIMDEQEHITELELLLGKSGESY
ncbi:MAG: ferritin-like domain-containing protein [Candidatus Brockarchaeota archaeon]|nr:ferritin-like domain-containing protein [Candidatus Brockarchaeota archaeon]